MPNHYGYIRVREGGKAEWGWGGGGGGRAWKNPLTSLSNMAHTNICDWFENVTL